MISDNRLSQIASYVFLNGKKAASEKYKIDSESVTRYIRMARERGLVNGENDLVEVKRPNVLVLDIETTPMEVNAWRLGKTHLGPTQVIKDVHLLSYAVKWLFEVDVYADILTPQELEEWDDSRLASDIWKFVDYADFIIAHNGIRFDMAMLNTRFMMNKMYPPSPYQVIDTLRAFQGIANFSSNKQGYLNQVLGLTAKMENEGLALWQKCVHGDKEALKTMLEYNIQDTKGLEDLYEVIRPWMKSHPNLSLYHDTSTIEKCHRCGGSVTWIEGRTYDTPLNRYPVYRCDVCHGVGRGRASIMSKDDRKCLTSNIAR